LSPDELSATINRLSAGHKHFRFSPDFRQVLVLINEKKTERCYRIEQAGNGKWGLPVEVLKSIRGEFNHATPALSVDHTKFYVSAYGVLANNILVFDSNDQVNYHALPIDEFSRIDRVIPIGTNSFLLQAQKKSEDKTGYYLIELVGKNQYTAPLFIKELSDGIDFVPFEVSITPYPGWVLFGKFNSGQLYMVKLPAIIADAWNTRSNPSREQITQEVNPPKSTFVSPVGSYHALLIGNDDYVVDGLDLDQPGKDVKRLKEILVNAYTFDEENVHVLINASRSDIFNALYKLRESLTRAEIGRASCRERV